MAEIGDTEVFEAVFYNTSDAPFVPTPTPVAYITNAAGTVVVNGSTMTQEGSSVFWKYEYTFAAAGKHKFYAYTSDASAAGGGYTNVVTVNVGETVKVGSLADGAITAAAIATGAIDADALAASAAGEIADAVLDELIADHATTGSLSQVIAAIKLRTDLLSGEVRNLNPYDSVTRTLSLTVGDDYTEVGIPIPNITVSQLPDLTTATSMTFGFVRAGLRDATTADTFSIDMSDVTANGITLKPTEAFTSRLMEANGRPYKILAVKSGKNISVLSGTLSISPRLIR